MRIALLLSLPFLVLACSGTPATGMDGPSSTDGSTTSTKDGSTTVGDGAIHGDGSTTTDGGSTTTADMVTTTTTVDMVTTATADMVTTATADMVTTATADMVTTTTTADMTTTTTTTDMATSTTATDMATSTTTTDMATSTTATDMATSTTTTDLATSTTTTDLATLIDSAVADDGAVSIDAAINPDLTTVITTTDGAAATDLATTSTSDGGGTFVATAPVGLAVVNTDFSTTTISLVNPSTGVVTDDCFDSSSTATGLTNGLSGDVVIPSRPQPGNELLLIDQDNSALIYLDPSTCGFLRQVAVDTGFGSNPHDVVGLSPTKAYVTRYEANDSPSGTAGAFDQGNDVLIVNPTTGAVTGRIDLTAYATTVSGANILPRADRALYLKGKVYVTLDEISDDFSALGAGRVVIIDPSTDTVTGTIDLPNQKDCSALDYAADTSTLLVTCTGDFTADLATATSQSAILLFDISGASPVLTKTIPASTIGSPFGAAAAVSGALAFSSVYGDFSGTPPDSLQEIDLSAGTASKVADASGAYVFGAALADTTRQKVYVPNGDFTSPTLDVYDASNPAAVTRSSSIVTDPLNGQSPASIGWY